MSSLARPDCARAASLAEPLDCCVGPDPAKDIDHTGSNQRADILGREGYNVLTCKEHCKELGGCPAAAATLKNVGKAAADDKKALELVQRAMMPSALIDKAVSASYPDFTRELCHAHLCCRTLVRSLSLSLSLSLTLSLSHSLSLSLRHTHTHTHTHT